MTRQLSERELRYLSGAMALYDAVASSPTGFALLKDNGVIPSCFRPRPMPAEMPVNLKATIDSIIDSAGSVVVMGPEMPRPCVVVIAIDADGWSGWVWEEGNVAEGLIRAVASALEALMLRISVSRRVMMEASAEREGQHSDLPVWLLQAVAAQPGGRGPSVWEPILAGLSSMPISSALWSEIAKAAGEVPLSTLVAWLSAPAAPLPASWQGLAAYDAHTRDIALEALLKAHDGALTCSRTDHLAAAALVARLSLWAMTTDRLSLALALSFEGPALFQRFMEARS